MTNLDFDKALREKLEDYGEQPDEAMWQGIERKMEHRRRMVIFRAVSAGFAAAACLIAGLFLFAGKNDIDSVPLAGMENTIAEAVENEDIPSMENQIAAFVADKDIVAEAMPVKKTVVKNVGKEKDILAIMESDGQSPVDESEIDSGEIANDNEKPVLSAVFNQQVSDKYAYEKDPFDELPSISSLRPNRNTSFTISSNMSPKSSQSGFVYHLAPSHAASLTGENVLSGVEPLSEARYSVPLTFGLQARFALSDRWALGTGVSYTYLQTGFDQILVNKEKFERASSQLHYIGIPVSVFYNVLYNRRLSLYAKLGGTVEKGIKSRLVYADKEVSGKIEGVQLSAMLGVGIEYRFLNNLGIYIDPSMAYYFDNNQPQSIRTEYPLSYSFELGLRFIL